MIKKIAIIAVLVAASAARGDIAINWFGSAGFYNWNEPNGAPSDPNGYINFGGGSATAYLIWSSDNTIDAINAGTLGAGGVSGNDTVLDSVAVGNAPYGDYSNGAEIYAGALDTGFVYLRIIDLSAPGGAIGQYFNSSILDPALYNPAAPVVQSLDNNVSPGAVGNQMIAVVPEPSTYAFMGLGAVLLAIRRFRRS